MRVAHPVGTWEEEVKSVDLVAAEEKRWLHISEGQEGHQFFSQR